MKYRGKKIHKNAKKSMGKTRKKPAPERFFLARRDFHLTNIIAQRGCNFKEKRGKNVRKK